MGCWCLVGILKIKCDQNLWYDLKKLLWHDELNPRVRCAFGNVFDILNMLNIFYCITGYVYFRFSVLRGRLRRVPWVWGNSFASLEVCLWKSQGCIFCLWKSHGCIFWGFLHLPSDMCHVPCDKEVLSTLCIGLGVWYKYDIKICNPRNWRLRQFVGTRPTTTSLLLDLDLVRFPLSLLRMFSYS